MAVLTLSDNYPPRGPSLRGAVYIYTRRGVVIAAKWPRKRGPAKTAQHKEQVAWFRDARNFSKYTFAREQIAAREASEGTPLLPHDTIMSALAGRLLAVTYPDGTMHRSLRAMNDVSRSLDIITNEPGDILIRGTNAWQGMPGGFGSGGVWSSAKDNGNSASEHCAKGASFNILPRVNILTLAALCDQIDNAKYLMQVWTVDGNFLNEKLVETPTLTAGSTARAWQEFTLPAPVTIPGSSKIVLLHIRTDATNATPSGARAASDYQVGLPNFDPIGYVYLDSTNPVYGDEPSILGSYNPYAVFIKTSAI